MLAGATKADAAATRRARRKRLRIILAIGGGLEDVVLWRRRGAMVKARESKGKIRCNLAR